MEWNGLYEDNLRVPPVASFDQPGSTPLRDPRTGPCGVSSWTGTPPIFWASASTSIPVATPQAAAAEFPDASRGHRRAAPRLPAPAGSRTLRVRSQREARGRPRRCFVGMRSSCRWSASSGRSYERPGVAVGRRTQSRTRLVSPGNRSAGCSAPRGSPRPLSVQEQYRGHPTVVRATSRVVLSFVDWESWPTPGRGAGRLPAIPCLSAPPALVVWLAKAALHVRDGEPAVPFQALPGRPGLFPFAGIRNDHLGCSAVEGTRSLATGKMWGHVPFPQSNAPAEPSSSDREADR